LAVRIMMARVRWVNGVIVFLLGKSRRDHGRGVIGMSGDAGPPHAALRISAVLPGVLPVVSAEYVKVRPPFDSEPSTQTGGTCLLKRTPPHPPRRSI
jgi:hypothetical protein